MNTTRSPFDALRSMLSDYWLIDLTADQTVRLFKDEHALLGEVQEFGAADTCCREKAVDVLAQQLGFGKRPTYADGPAKMDTYTRILIATLEKEGIAHRIT